MNRRKYFTPREISVHVTADDLWVSLFGKVLNLSPLCSGKDVAECFPLLAFAGKDISHLFEENREVKFHVDPNTNRISPFLPFQSFTDVPSQEETEKSYLERRQQDERISLSFMQKYMSQRLGVKSDDFRISYSQGNEIDHDNQDSDSKLLGRKYNDLPNNFQNPDSKSAPWWKDEKYVIGCLTHKSRWIKIMNTMIFRHLNLEVCSEETIEDILERYLKFNCHARSYTWKYLGEILNMEQTLENNGVPDHDEKAERLRLNSEDFVPTLTLYFNNDLTEM